MGFGFRVSGLVGFRASGLDPETLQPVEEEMMHLPASSKPAGRVKLRMPLRGSVLEVCVSLSEGACHVFDISKIVSSLDCASCFFLPEP